MEKIIREEFNMWLKDNVTMQMLDALRSYRKRIEDSMLNANFLSPNAQLGLSHLSGVREGIDFVLNINIEDIDKNEEN